MEQHSAPVEKRQSKISSSSGHQSPMASGFPLTADIGQLAYVPPSCVAVERRCPLPVEDRYNRRVGQVPHDEHALSRDKRMFLKPEAGKDSHTR